MPLLPAFGGRFAVGLATFSRRVPREVYGTARLPNGEPALRLEEIAFSVFYPADVEKHGLKKPPIGVDWMVRPLSMWLTGYTKFTSFSRWLVWPIVYFFGSLLKIPAYANAPLLIPQPNPNPSKGGLNDTPKWPLIIFSHGLAGSRTTYSHICGRLAAEGNIVLAIEHRDGSGPACMVFSEAEGKRVLLPYTRMDEVVWGEQKPDAQYPLRVEQLPFRVREVYETYQAFANLVRGVPANLQLIDGKEYDWAVWKDRVQVDENLVYIGHSFGGATGFALLSSEPPPSQSPLPLSHVMLLDPWLDPLAEPGPFRSSYYKDYEFAVINSDAFTVWKEHFTRLLSLVETWKRNPSPDVQRFVTIVGSGHQDVSDFSLMLPIKRKKALGFMDTVHTLITAFLRGQLEQEIASRKTVPMEVLRNRKGKKHLKGNFGDLVVH